MMNFVPRSQFHHLVVRSNFTNPPAKPPFPIYIKTTSHLKPSINPFPSPRKKTHLGSKKPPEAMKAHLKSSDSEGFPQLCSFEHKPAINPSLLELPKEKAHPGAIKPPETKKKAPKSLESEGFQFPLAWASGYTSRYVICGAIAWGIALFFLGIDEQRALALGPDGPLVEEFWENVRRYFFYFLTVSTGAIYTVLQPIGELLKNPITAIFAVAIIGVTIYVLSLVLSAMFGVSDFVYDYGY
ncbi:uncharacterized protein LOC131158075 [Malania oleifera]|uniref:uncharacterized protein LOC131158075 n=1 Tax=Malania oleifera TaxID=397392 RepID=UPI0025AE53C4|nr:uncharacterized protein LOC131158075 [Malania oleifera]